MKKQSTTETVQVQAVRQGVTRFRIIGTTPLYQNRMSEKVRQQLLIGGRKKTTAERALIKHNPLEEFRSAAETVGQGPTALGMRSVAIKSAICDAAIETAGVTKASTQRLIFMPGMHVPLYGIPQLKCDVVRSADINKTPDIRTRAFLPRWACEVEVFFVMPQLSAHSIATLLANAGILIGLGDFRQQKGKGSYGAFRILGPDEPDEEWDHLVKHEGRDAQLAALESPELADADTAELIEFYNEEVSRRAA